MDTKPTPDLIAAAPDLLAACEALTDEDRLVEFAALCRAYSAEPVINLLAQVFPEVEAAIAKAQATTPRPAPNSIGGHSRVGGNATSGEWETMEHIEIDNPDVIQTMTHQEAVSLLGDVWFGEAGIDDEVCRDIINSLRVGYARAVNAHDDLLSACLVADAILTALMGTYPAVQGWTREARDWVRAAITKAQAATPDAQSGE
jgi:hypothetical protein